jgi:hypothetical protein
MGEKGGDLKMVNATIGKVVKVRDGKGEFRQIWYF